MQYTIVELTPESKRVDITVKLIAKAEPRYAKGYKITNFTAADSTGQITIPFWNDQVRLVKVGDFIQIQNGYMSVFREQKQLNVGKYGSFQVIPPIDGFEVGRANTQKVDPQFSQDTTPVELLDQKTKFLTLHVVIQEKVEEKIVRGRKDGKEHRVGTYLVGDATGCIHLSLWDDLIDLVEIGSSVMIYNGYVKIFRGQRTLYIARNGKVTPTEDAITLNRTNNLSEKIEAF